MLALWRLIVRVGLPLCVAGTTGMAFAEGIDDPKLERRLGTRVELAPPVAAPGGVPGIPGAADAVAPAPAGELMGPPAADSVATIPPPADDAAGPAARHVPHLMLAYRRFSFAQIGPTAASGPSQDEPFNVVSLDLYPVSSSWRCALSTQYGWEDGTFRANGDAFIAQSVALGGQIPGEVFTPFFEAHAGGGYMQRTHAGLNTIATAYGQLGVDVGADLFLARYAFLSAALGYLHATNGFAKDNAFGSFSVDTWSFKLGFGL
jgi:hypothetical protein